MLPSLVTRTSSCVRGYRSRGTRYARASSCFSLRQGCPLVFSQLSRAGAAPTPRCCVKMYSGEPVSNTARPTPGRARGSEKNTSMSMLRLCQNSARPDWSWSWKQHSFVDGYTRRTRSQVCATSAGRCECVGLLYPTAGGSYGRQLNESADGQRRESDDGR